MNDVAIAARQVGYEQRMFWRNPPAAVFTFLFPVIFLVIFASLNSNTTIDFLGGLRYNQYYVPGLIAFGIMGATYVNLAVTVAFRREAGTLKRIRGMPIPAWVFMGGLIGNAAVVSAVLVALVAGVGIAFYGVTFPGHYVSLLLALIVGAFCFCSLGLASSVLIPNADAAPAVVNAIHFPLVFISGVFFPVRAGSFLAQLSSVFPHRRFINAVFSAFDPRQTGAAIAGTDLLVMTAWGAVGLAIAIRYFRWEPQRK